MTNFKPNCYIEKVINVKPANSDSNFILKLFNLIPAIDSVVQSSAFDRLKFSLGKPLTTVLRKEGFSFNYWVWWLRCTGGLRIQNVGQNTIKR